MAAGTTLARVVEHPASEADVTVRPLEAGDLDAADRVFRLDRVETGVSTARRDAYRILASCGYRTFAQGVAMHRPDSDAFDRPDAFVLDDRR